MSEISCSRCGARHCNPLARIDGKAFDLRCFMGQIARHASHHGPDERMSVVRMGDFLRAAIILHQEAAAIKTVDTDACRRELAGDVLDDLRPHIQHIEREYYSLAQSLLPAHLQAPRVCRHCGRTGKPDDSDWLYWDLCGDEECGARDSGARVLGDEEDQ